MKTWKLVSGILSCIFFILVTFQSCAVGIGEALTESEETGSAGGILLAVLMIAGGIVSIATRKGGKGSNIALIILFGLAALIGFSNAGSYTDLNIWAGWCLINAIVAVIALITAKSSRKSQSEDD